MMTPVQQEVVDRLLQQTEDVAQVAQGVAKLTRAEQLFAFASDYNWDSGIQIPIVIADHPLCDRATALLLFWRAEGLYCLQLDSPPPYQEDWFQFCKTLTYRLLHGHYGKGPNAFDPQLSRVQRYKYEQQSISPLLLDPESPV